jgi:hypothetical protein
MTFRPYYLWILVISFLIYLLERGYEEIATFVIFIGVIGLSMWWLFWRN